MASIANHHSIQHDVGVPAGKAAYGADAHAMRRASTFSPMALVKAGKYGAGLRLVSSRMPGPAQAPALQPATTSTGIVVVVTYNLR